MKTKKVLGRKKEQGNKEERNNILYCGPVGLCTASLAPLGQEHSRRGFTRCLVN